MENILYRNHVKVIGKGEKTIVFAHGFGCDQNMWRFITPHFEENYRIILFDYVGSGQSDYTAYDQVKYSDLYGYTEDLLDVIDALKVSNAVFVGHSVSSMIGMLASIQRPDYFDSLIMIGPSPRYLNDKPDYIGGFEKKDVVELLEMMEMNFVGWASYLAPVAMNAPEQPGLVKELEKSFTSGDPTITREFAAATFFSDYRQELEKVTIPSFIIQCSDDSIVPLEVGHYLHQHLKKSQFQLMKAKGHYPHLSHPEETSKLIQNYLSDPSESVYR